MSTGLLRAALICIVILSSTCLQSLAISGTFVAFGPQTYIRGSGNPVPVTNAFTVLNPTTYTLQIYNGGLVDGEFEKVSSSVITLNGVQIVGPNEFNQNVTLVEKPVTVIANNQLSVEVRGKPGGGITLQILGVDNDPPTITAAVNPAPNSAGWHKSDAIVSFTCADSESGVASCPAPVVVSMEAANQLVSGTATDRAGNSASATLIISLDKTTPAVVIGSPANGSSVTSSPVNVTGTATEYPSGLATVLCNGSPASLSASTFSCDVPLTNGPNTITVEATDLAGNQGSSSITVNLGQSESLPPDPQTTPSASNDQGTLYGEHMGDFIVFQFATRDVAAEYFVYTAPSINGPWEQTGRFSQGAARTGGAKVDDSPEVKVMDRCYKVEVIDAAGLVVEIYEPICVPKFVR